MKLALLLAVACLPSCEAITQRYDAALERYDEIRPLVRTAAEVLPKVVTLVDQVSKKVDAIDTDGDGQWSTAELGTGVGAILSLLFGAYQASQRGRDAAALARNSASDERKARTEARLEAVETLVGKP